MLPGVPRRPPYGETWPRTTDILISHCDNVIEVTDTNVRSCLVTRLRGMGFGAGAIGNLYRAIPDAEASAAVRAALDNGVKYFDTAPHYGFGLSEKRLGAPLRGGG